MAFHFDIGDEKGEYGGQSGCCAGCPPDFFLDLVDAVVVFVEYFFDASAEGVMGRLERPHDFGTGAELAFYLAVDLFEFQGDFTVSCFVRAFGHINFGFRISDYQAGSAHPTIYLSWKAGSSKPSPFSF